MADTGFKSPTATGDDHNEWNNPSNAFSSDDTRADSGVSTTNLQDYYNFSFDLSDAEAIAGIVVSIEGRAPTTEDGGVDVDLSHDGGATYGTVKRAEIFGATDEIIEVGGSSDTWGRTWAVSELDNTNFRVRVKAARGDGEMEMDHIQVKIFYLGPGDIIYSREATATLPTNADTLATVYSESEENDVSAKNGVRVGITGSSDEYALHQFQEYFADTSLHATAEWYGQTDVAPSTSEVKLQAYNHSTGAWEDIDTDNTTGADTDFTLSGQTSGTASDYYDGDGAVTFRVYQQEPV